MEKTLDDNARAGALNLLSGCAKARAGERLLIAHEPARLGYYDAGVFDIFLSVARDLGLAVETFDVGFQPETPRIDADLATAMSRADVTLFLARLGDQLRFSSMPEARIVTCYAVTPELLA